MQEHGSAKTSLKQIASGFKKILWNPGTTNLDMGGGKFELATDYLKGLGVRNRVYDPYNRTLEHNTDVLMEFALQKADTATCFNVLNVIKERQARLKVLTQLKALVKRGGTIYIGIYEGNHSGEGKPTLQGCWQNNTKLVSYLPEILHVFGDFNIRKGVVEICNQP